MELRSLTSQIDVNSDIGDGPGSPTPNSRQKGSAKITISERKSPQMDYQKSLLKIKDITALNSYRKSLPFNNASELQLRVSPVNNANKSYLLPEGELSQRYEFRDSQRGSQDFGS